MAGIEVVKFVAVISAFYNGASIYLPFLFFSFSSKPLSSCKPSNIIHDNKITKT